MPSVNLKRAGLIGGATWHSSAKYYEILNREIALSAGEYASANLVLWNLNFAQIVQHQKNNNWDAIAHEIAHISLHLQSNGCNAIVLCSNTLHKVVSQVQGEGGLAIPFLHVCDALAVHCKARDIRTVGLLGTRFTMNQRFYVDFLQQQGIQVLLPNSASKILIDDIIFTQLAKGVVTMESREKYLQVCTELEQLGAEAVVLGCTEIGLLLQDGNHALPLLDTTELHAKYVGQWMVSN